MNGRRLPDGTNYVDTQPGDYWRTGSWFVRDPIGQLGNLTHHEVMEHEDGTITVYPSIRIWSFGQSWHGFLERGVWREA